MKERSTPAARGPKKPATAAAAASEKKDIREVARAAQAAKASASPAANPPLTGEDVAQIYVFLGQVPTANRQQRQVLARLENKLLAKGMALGAFGPELPPAPEA